MAGWGRWTEGGDRWQEARLEAVTTVQVRQREGLAQHREGDRDGGVGLESSGPQSLEQQAPILAGSALLLLLASVPPLHDVPSRSAQPMHRPLHLTALSVFGATPSSALPPAQVHRGGVRHPLDGRRCRRAEASPRSPASERQVDSRQVPTLWPRLSPFTAAAPSQGSCCLHSREQASSHRGTECRLLSQARRVWGFPRPDCVTLGRYLDRSVL